MTQDTLHTFSIYPEKLMQIGSFEYSALVAIVVVAVVVALSILVVLLVAFELVSFDMGLVDPWNYQYGLHYSFDMGLRRTRYVSK